MNLGKSPHAVWMIPGLLLFPPGLACLLVAAHYCYVWLRVERFRPHRWVYSSAVSMLGSGIASIVYHLITGPESLHGRLTDSPLVLPAMAIAALIVTANNLLMVGMVIRLAQPGVSTRAAFGGRNELVIGAVNTCMGFLVAAAITVTPPLAIAMVPVLYLVQRSLLVAQLVRAAETDSKTQLVHANAWRVHASREIDRAARSNTSVSVLMIDLDHFKRINDTYGHLAGDQVLFAVARVIERETRSYDLVGRFGGEEFIVLLQADQKYALEVAERIRVRIAQAVVPISPLGDDPGGQQHSPIIEGLSASIGVATRPGEIAELDDLLRAADENMYLAKSGGRDRVVCAPA